MITIILKLTNDMLVFSALESLTEFDKVTLLLSMVELFAKPFKLCSEILDLSFGNRLSLVT